MSHILYLGDSFSFFAKVVLSVVFLGCDLDQFIDCLLFKQGFVPYRILVLCLLHSGTPYLRSFLCCSRSSSQFSISSSRCSICCSYFFLSWIKFSFSCLMSSYESFARNRASSTVFTRCEYLSDSSLNKMS